ncbi:FkbM family methyltransferase [Leptothermofonsia sp. ETS-13]|uniref:FkbM family methyltransferase n=1 Tax=Leptothermofonsia sp. ETS-13 TaxID=3035696 RepID=UPI003BA2B7C2
MKSYLNKLIRYVRGVLSSIGRLESGEFLRVMSDSDDVIKRIEKYNFSMILNIHDRAIGLPILLKSSYEENVTEVFLKYLKSDTCFLDIGANIGYYSLLAASQCPEGKVFSFEPDETNFRYLKTGIIYNRFDSAIQAYNLAASDRNGSIYLYEVSCPANSGAKVTAKDKESLNPYVKTENPQFQLVEAVQLDSFLAGKRIDIVKLDIEGHEPFALLGMKEILIQNKPVIITEFAPLSLNLIGKMSPEEFLQFLIDLSYQIHVIDEDGSLINCDRDISAVMQYFQNHRKNHIDLLLEAVCSSK